MMIPHEAGRESHIADGPAEIGAATTALDRIVIEQVIDIKDEIPLVGHEPRAQVEQPVVLQFGEIILILKALVLIYRRPTPPTS